MSNKAVAQFCNQVGRKLRCSPMTRRTLLQGLEEELSELPDADKASLVSLEANLGTVSQVAAELQVSISSEEESRAVQKKQRKTILMIGGVVGLALIVILLAILLFSNGPFYVVEIIQEG